MGIIKADGLIEELDGKLFEDVKSGKHILFTFEDEHTIVLDVCSCKEPDHSDYTNLESFIIRL